MDRETIHIRGSLKIITELTSLTSFLPSHFEVKSPHAIVIKTNVFCHVLPSLNLSITLILTNQHLLALTKEEATKSMMKSWLLLKRVPWMLQ